MLAPEQNDGATTTRRSCRNCGREITGKRAAGAVLCAGCRSDDAIPGATTRKVLNRGRTPIAYLTPQHGWRYGWIVRELRTGTVLGRFPGDPSNTRIHGRDLRYVDYL